MVKSVRQSVDGRHRGVPQRRQPRRGEGDRSDQGGRHRAGGGGVEVCRGSGDLGGRSRGGEGHPRHDDPPAPLPLVLEVRGGGVLDVSPAVGLEVYLPFG